MTLEEIWEEWAIDGPLKDYDLAGEAINVPKLHHKYHKMLSFERMKRFKMEAEISTLKRIKSEYYMGTLDQDTMKEKGYRPFKIRVLKTDLSTYIDSDQEMINNNFKLSMIKEKIAALESIVNLIIYRNGSISNAIADIKFKNGSL